MKATKECIVLSPIMVPITLCGRVHGRDGPVQDHGRGHCYIRLEVDVANRLVLDWRAFLGESLRHGPSFKPPRCIGQGLTNGRYDRAWRT
jgi:hypothetical protein